MTMISSVRAAFCDCGCLNAVTPFEIDSVPVRAAEPDAKALSTTKDASAPAPLASGCGTVAVGHVPNAHLPMPTAERPVQHEDEAVGREGEEEPRLPDAAEVSEREDQDAAEGERDPVRLQPGDGRRERENARQRPRRRRSARSRPEAMLRQPTPAAFPRFSLAKRTSRRSTRRPYSLHVRKDDDHHEDRDRDRQREDEMRRRQGARRRARRAPPRSRRRRRRSGRTRRPAARGTSGGACCRAPASSAAGR